MRKLILLLMFVMSVGLFGCQAENDVKITENVGQFEDNNLYQVSIDGVVYSFPMLYSEFEAMGWTYEYGMTDTIESGDWEYGHLWTNGEIRIQTTMANLSESEKPYSECMIAGIYFDDYYGYDAEDEIVMPGGIQIGVSTRKDILAAYGEPSSEEDREENYRLSYWHDYYSKILFYLDEESGILTEVDVENCIPMAGTPHCFSVEELDEKVFENESITEGEEDSSNAEMFSEEVVGEDLLENILTSGVERFTADDYALVGSYIGTDGKEYGLNVYTEAEENVQEIGNFYVNEGTETNYTLLYKIEEHYFCTSSGWYLRSEQKDGVWVLHMYDSNDEFMDTLVQTAHYES